MWLLSEGSFMGNKVDLCSESWSKLLTFYNFINFSEQKGSSNTINYFKQRKKAHF